MRELKFRAWDNKKQMWANFKILDNMVYFMDKVTGVWIRDSKYPDRFSLLQYTGLKDKNGKEIYEGDIVKVYDDFFRSGLDDEYGVIKFDNGRFYINTFKKYPNECFCYFEVVGNIYENPELLEGN